MGLLQKALAEKASPPSRGLLFRALNLGQSQAPEAPVKKKTLKLF